MGVFQKICEVLNVEPDIQEVMIDSTIVRAHPGCFRNLLRQVALDEQ